MQDIDLSFFDYIDIIKKKFKIIISIIISLTLLASILSFIMKDHYQAEIHILPLGEGSSRSGGLLDLASRIGMLTSNGDQSQSSSDKIKVILRSRSFLEKIVNKFHLIDLYFGPMKQYENIKDPQKIPSMEDAVVKLKRGLETVVDEETKTMKISYDSKDPIFAEKILRGIIEELQLQLKERTLSEAKKQRVFISNQLSNRKKEFFEVSNEINDFYRNNKVSIQDSSVMVNDQMLSNDFDTDTDESTMTSQVMEVEKKLSSLPFKDESKKVFHINVPQNSYLEYLLQKKIYLSELVNLLSQQYEMAKMKEARESVSFEIIDDIQLPKYPYKPNRVIIIWVSFIMSCFFAVFVVVVVKLLSYQWNQAKQINRTLL